MRWALLLISAQGFIPESIPRDFKALYSTKSPKTVIIGAGWGGLSAAYRLAPHHEVTLVDAAPRAGGLVRDGYTTTSKRPAEAGQHGFWNNYHNIYRLLDDLQLLDCLTDYAEQGQYSPAGLEAVWPVYRDQPLELPTGLAQAAFTRFTNLPLLDQATALPLVLAFSEFDDKRDWGKYDEMSFYDLCVQLGVSERCYREAFEPMILTGLFAPGRECSAAAALGMAYFFVLQSQKAFDVQWCRGNIGDCIFQAWLDQMDIDMQASTKVTGFVIGDDEIQGVKCQQGDTTTTIECDNVILAVGANALCNFAKFCPELAGYPEFQGFANLRGTSVLATRVFLDRPVDVTYSANACWGFDEGVGMTLFDIRKLHGDDAPTVQGAPGAVLEVDYYHANRLLVLSDEQIVEKVKRDIDTILKCSQAKVVDAAVVRLPQAVNWYFPGSYRDMPSLRSKDIANLYFAGDIVKTNHGSWSQEKAFVTGKQAANLVLGQPAGNEVLPVAGDEGHVALGKQVLTAFKSLVGGRSLFVDHWR